MFRICASRAGCSSEPRAGSSVPAGLACVTGRAAVGSVCWDVELRASSSFAVSLIGVTGRASEGMAPFTPRWYAGISPLGHVVPLTGPEPMGRGLLWASWFRVSVLCVYVALGQLLLGPVRGMPAPYGTLRAGSASRKTVCMFTGLSMCLVTVSASVTGPWARCAPLFPSGRLAPGGGALVFPGSPCLWVPRRHL